MPTETTSCRNCGKEIWRDPKSGIWRHMGGDRACPGSPEADPEPALTMDQRAVLNWFDSGGEPIRT